MAVQFVAPEQASDTARIQSPGVTVRAPVLDEAYLVYEARLARPGRDFAGHSILPRPIRDVARQRIYFLEITAIQLSMEIAEGRRQIHWQSLPDWTPADNLGFLPAGAGDPAAISGFTKGYSAHYRFPGAATIAFEWDAVEGGRAVKFLPPLPEDQVEVDDDRARWPCFFPSSLGLITTWTEAGQPNLMPCGSTTVISDDPLVLAPCVAYAPINQRYAPRKTLELIRATGRFGCGAAYVDARMLAAIRYAGNVSLAQDPEKPLHAGLEVAADSWAPRLLASPLHLECEVIDEIALGTHVMFLGAVRRMVPRGDLTAHNPLRWSPWATLGPWLSPG